MRLRNFDVGAFLRDAWQARPLLVRTAWDDWRNPLEPDELAGLACEPGVESRLVTRLPERWELEHGPWPESRFGKLGRQPWTLLVQAVDHHVPAVAALLDAFRFVPNWRVDDVMVSYAVDGGGVGAHFDNYDVFLVQGLGRRRWQVGQRCDHATKLLPHDDLRLLANFEPVDEWILEPGDMLYVPPGVAHDGIAVGDDCMTYSIGFRAPSRAELVAAWAEDVLAELEDDDRFTDPGRAAPANPGEIIPRDLARLQALVAERMLDRDSFAQWFGRYATAPRSSEIDWRPDLAATLDDLSSHAAAGSALLRNPASRFSFVRGQAGALSLFVDGRSYACAGAAADFAERLCAAGRVEAPGGLNDPEIAALLLDLLNHGSVAFDPA